MKFVHVKDPYHSPYWMILVSTTGELIEWYVEQTIVKSAVFDLFNRVAVGRHASTNIAALYEQGFHSYSGVEDLAQQLSDLVFRPKAKALENGPILINAEGGFCNYLPTYHEVTASVERDEMVWPEIQGDVRFLQWENGKHWYAKVGPHDVIVDGHAKWNTRRQAEKAVSKFLAEK